MVKQKEQKPIMKMPEIRTVRTSTYAVTCPYCDKELSSVYIKQLNQHYAMHIKNCKDNDLNLKEVKKNG